MNMRRAEQGSVNGSVFTIVALVILVILFGSFGVWSYMNYMDQKTNTDQKVEEATAAAVLDASEKLQAKFEEESKKPLRLFVGPSDYGRLTFEYDKRWSAFQESDVSQGGGVTYAAYLNPVIVPPVSETTKFALRITIEQKIYDKALDEYAGQIKKGDLKSSVYIDGDRTGTRLTGNFNKDIVGTAVLIKMRDRTLTLRTDGDVFLPDFEAILKTVKFNE